MTLNRYVYYWLPVIIWMGVISWLSTDTFSPQNTSQLIVPALRFLLPETPPQTLDMLHTLIRKSAHVGEYFILGVLLFRAFRGSLKASGVLQWAAYAVIAVVLFAAADEIHQSFTVQRTCSAVDVLIDTVGGTFAQAVCILRYRSRKNSE